MLQSWVPLEEITMEVNYGVSHDHSLVLDLVPGDGVSFICCHA